MRITTMRRAIGTILAWALFFAPSALAAAPALHVPSGHSGTIRAATFSPGGRYAITGGDDGTIRVWEAESGKELREWSVGDQVFSLQALADGKTLASYHETGEGKARRAALSVWDYSSGAELSSQPAPRDAEHVRAAFAADGRVTWIAQAGTASGEGAIGAWDLKSGKRLFAIPGAAAGNLDLSISADGRYALTTADYQGPARLWELSSGTELWEKGSCFHAAFSPDGQRAYIGGYGAIKILSIPSGEVSGEIAAEGQCEKLLPSPDGKSLVALWAESRDESGFYRSCKVIDLASGTVTKGFVIKPLSPEKPTAYALAPDGSSLLVAAGPLAAIYDLGTGAMRCALKGRAAACRALALSEDGRTLLSCCADVLSLWDTSTGRAMKAIPADYESVWKAALSPDRRRIAVAGERRDRTDPLSEAASVVDIWDAASGERLSSLRAFAQSLSFTKDGSYALCAARDGTIRQIDASTGEELAALIGHRRDVRDVAASPDGRSLASVGGDGTLRFWDLATGRERRPLREYTDPMDKIAYSRDGKSLLVVKDGGIHAFDAETGEEHQDQVHPLGDFDRVSDLSYSRDRGFAAIVAEGKGLAILDLATDELRESFERDIAGQAADAVLSPDGATVYVASPAGTVRCLSAKGGSLLATFMASPTGDWLSFAPGDYFEGSPGALAGWLDVVDGLRTYELGQFFERLHRPDLVAAALAGSRQAAGAGLAGASSRPPELSITIAAKDGGFKFPGEAISLRGLAVVGAKAADWLVENGRVTVRVSARDAGGGVDGVRLYVNGKAIGADSRGLAVVAAASGAAYSRDFSVPLASGENLLRAVGYSKDRIESEPAELKIDFAPAQPVKPSLYVLALGADAYKNPKYGLNYALADAGGFLDSFCPLASRLFASVKVTKLYDGALTREALLKALAAIQEAAKPDDAFVLFYAGRGLSQASDAGSDFYFVLPPVADAADQAQLKALSISSSELRDRCALIPATKQLLLVEACGAGAEVAAGAVSRGAVEDLALAQLARSSGQAVIAAAGDRPSSGELAALGHGVFVASLLRGFAGKAAKPDGRITVASLKLWLDGDVPSLSSAYRGAEQYPTAFLFGQDFPLGIAGPAR